MSNDLYDTGAPKRIIVEHRHTHDVMLRRPEASYCDLEPRVQCIGGPHPPGPCPDCPFKRESRVTITPEFQPVEEKKRLK